MASASEACESQNPRELPSVLIDILRPRRVQETQGDDRRRQQEAELAHHRRTLAVRRFGSYFGQWLQIRLGNPASNSRSNDHNRCWDRRVIPRPTRP
jgi:hypothetical protein